MRVGMYNRWLATLGGGEKHSLAIAEYLSQNHEVEVISHREVSKEAAAQRLNLDLSRVEFVTVPDRPVQELGDITRGYDLFINASYMDYFVSEARYNVALIYFPTPLGLGTNINFHRQLKLLANKVFMIPSITSEPMKLEVGKDGHSRLTGSQVLIQLPDISSSYPLRFRLTSQDDSVVGANIFYGRKLIETISLPAGRSPVGFQFQVPEAKHSRDHTLSIEAVLKDGKPDPNCETFYLAIDQFQIDHPRFLTYQIMFEKLLKDVGWRLHVIPKSYSIRSSIQSYDMLWANSQFTKKWIRRYWKQDSEVLYPPIDTETFRPEEKKKYILNVGRFFSGSHNKKHLVMIQAFKEMVDNGLTGWELHLAGGTTPGIEHREYLQDVFQAAKDYPITIHTDIGFPDLVELYGVSSIYWHASGYGEDEKKEPGKLEHFGITTVEAMASGCVPVVIAVGGQPEIVVNGKNGFLWNTIGQLEEKTLKVIRDPELSAGLAETALQDSRRYSKKQFNSRLDTLLNGLSVRVEV